MDIEDEQDSLLESFFSNVGDRLDLVAAYESGIGQLQAPRFNLFGSTYIDPDENKITAILADLLNPKGSHCQGSVFLESFLALDKIKFNKPKDAVAKAVVQTEHLTGQNRRIDLTVWMGGCFLGLENKIDSSEHGNQVGHYVDFLSRLTNDWFFVFLNKDGAPPKECPAQWKEWLAQKKVASFSYADLSEWLRSCMESSSSDRVRALIYDMASWAKALTGERVKNPAEEAVKKFVLKRPEHLKTSLVVARAAAALRLELMKDFFKSLEALIMDELKNRIGCRAWSSTPKIGESDFEKGGYPGISFSANSWKQGCEIVIETKSTDFSEPYLGVSWPGVGEEVKTMLNDALNAEGIGKSRGDNRGWIWCPKLQYPGVAAGGGDDSEVLEAIHDGARKEHILRHFVDRIVRVANVVDKNGGHEEAA